MKLLLSLCACLFLLTSASCLGQSESFEPGVGPRFTIGMSPDLEPNAACAMETQDIARIYYQEYYPRRPISFVAFVAGKALAFRKEIGARVYVANHEGDNLYIDMLVSQACQLRQILNVWK